MGYQSILVYLVKNCVVTVSSYAWTPNGGHISMEPVLVCPSHDIPSIGSNVITCLGACQPNGPSVDWSQDVPLVPRFVGYTTDEEMEQHSRDISIEIENGCYHIFTEKPHIYLPLTSTIEKIGYAVLRAFGTSYEQELKKGRRQGHGMKH
jgi:hypothetical protein